MARVKEIAGIELWRQPDEFDNMSPSGAWAVWYGPAGKEGDTATAVRMMGGGDWMVGEIQSVVGLIEDPPEPFTVQSVVINLPEILAKTPAVKKLSTVYEGTDVQKADEFLEVEVSFVEQMRMVAGLGVEEMAQRGGGEDWASSLQEGIDTIIG